MGEHSIIHGDRENIEARFERLNQIDAFRLWTELGKRFSCYGYGYDKIEDGIARIAEELAVENKYDFAEDILEIPRLLPITARAVDFDPADWFDCRAIGDPMKGLRS